MLEAVDDFLKDGLVENHLLSLHDARHIGPGQQLATLQTDTVATSIEHVHPELLVQDLSCEYQHFHLWVALFGMSAYLHAYGSRTTQPQVEQHQVGKIVLDESPILGLILSCADNLGFGNVVTEDSFCAFQFQGHVFHDDYFKLFHCFLFMGLIVIHCD